MSQSTDGILAYGYDLGSPEDWKLNNLTDRGELVTPWLDETAEELYEDTDITELMEERLREVMADTELGVEVVSYCSAASPMYLLAATHTRVYRGHVEVIDVASMIVTGRMDAALSIATAALGIEPTQAQPQWLLVSDTDVWS